jgi:hypothetical protein
MDNNRYRSQDLNRFYQLLDKLEIVSPKKSLLSSSGKSPMPKQGIYFFFEKMRSERMAPLGWLE